MSESVKVFALGILPATLYGLSDEPYLAVMAIGCFMLAAALVVAEAINKLTAEVAKLNASDTQEADEPSDSDVGIG